MPIYEPAKVGLDEKYQKLLATYVEGKPDETKEIFIKELRGVKLLVTASTEAGATSPKGVTAMRNGKVLSADEFAGIRTAVYEEAAALMNNYATLKDKDGKAVPLSSLSLLKGIDLDGKPTEFTTDEVAVALLARMASKEGTDNAGPAFDGSLTAADGKADIDAKQALAMGGLVFDPKIAYIDKLPEPPKPIKIEGSAFKAQELLQKGILRMQFNGTNFGLVANTADGKIDDAAFLNMLASSTSAVAGGGSKTIISTPADFGGRNIGADGKPLDQASWLAANPAAAMPKGFVEQILTRAGMEEALPMVMAQMAAAEKAGKPFTRANLREAVMGALHDNFKLANGGKDASDIEVMFGSGAIANDLSQVPSVPSTPLNAVPQTSQVPPSPTVPQTQVAPTPQTPIASLFPQSQVQPQAQLPNAVPQANASMLPTTQDWATIQALFAMINAQNMQGLGTLTPAMQPVGSLGLPNMQMQQTQLPPITSLYPSA